MDKTVIALVAAVIGPLLAYIVAARKLSGKIGTSEASSLWAESTRIREEYREEIANLRKALIDCERRVSEVERKSVDLRVENEGLKRQVATHEATIEELRASLAAVSSENDVVRKENVQLRRRVGELEAAAK